MRICMHMVKVISLSEEAYALLRRYKGRQMSFSDTVIEHFSEHEKAKTEGTAELLAWIKNLPKSGRRERLSSRIDEIVYGVRK